MWLPLWASCGSPGLLLVDQDSSPALGAAARGARQPASTGLGVGGQEPSAKYVLALSCSAWLMTPWSRSLTSCATGSLTNPVITLNPGRIGNPRPAFGGSHGSFGIGGMSFGRRSATARSRNALQECNVPAGANGFGSARNR